MQKQDLTNYFLISNLFLLIFSILILYFLFFELTGIDYPIKSVYNNNISVTSTGLQRSIGRCVLMDFKGSAVYNKSGLSVFLFFLVQVLFRSAVFVFHRKINNRLVYADIIFSLLLFVFTFRNFVILYSLN